MMEKHIAAKQGIRASPYFLLAVLALGVFITTLDYYIFVPALPSIMRDLGSSLDWVTWTMTIFLLFCTAIMPLGGKLSDLFGRKRIYVIGVGTFTLASLACSLSWDVYSLIVFRAIQALGAGLVLPAAIASINASTPEEQKGKTMGVMMALAAVAMVIGPNLGGYFIEHFGWRTVFFINIPLGALAVMLMLKFEESYGEGGHGIDLIGSLLLTGGLGALMLGLVRLETLPFADVTVFPFFAGCVLLAAVLVLYESRARNPILDMRVLARGDVLSLNVAQLAINVSLACAMIYVPSFAQMVLHMNVQDSGTILTPLSISLMFAAIVGGVLLDKFGARAMLLLGCVIASGAIFYLAQYVADSAGLAIALVGLGVGLGIGMGAFQIIMLSFMPEGEKGTGSGILNTFKSVGGAIGSVIGGFFLSEATRGTVTLDRAFHNVFWIGVAMAIAASLLVVCLIVLGRRRARKAATVPLARH